MSMQDPISDLFTRLRNAQRARKVSVQIGMSKFASAVCDVLKQEGYIKDTAVTGEGAVKHLHVELKYHDGKPVIETIKRVSRPGLRIYKACSELPTVLGGLGIVIVSTPKGLMTGQQARQHGLGGEIVGYVA